MTAKDIENLEYPTINFYLYVLLLVCSFGVHSIGGAENILAVSPIEW